MYSLIHNNPQLYTLMIVIIEHTYAFMAAIAAYIRTHNSCNNGPHVLVFIAAVTAHFFTLLGCQNNPTFPCYMDYLKTYSIVVPNIKYEFYNKFTQNYTFNSYL
jgi:hypothetical protein